jgi:hypothetical protein
VLIEALSSMYFKHPAYEIKREYRFPDE